MKLTIETIPRGPRNEWGEGSMVALAYDERGISQGGVAEGWSERGAIQGAVNSFFDRERTRSQAAGDEALIEANPPAVSDPLGGKLEVAA